MSEKKDESNDQPSPQASSSPAGSGVTRSPGRYNLHRLGWTAFEDLCMQILRLVLGETCSRYRDGTDGGRDGWFRGKIAGKLGTQNGLSGSFIVQCKHTSKAQLPLRLSDVDDELAKVERLTKTEPAHYLLMTNRQVSAIAEKEIREAFERIPGCTSCLVLAETWIEDTVDAHPRLLRIVPRLYGIGDLSQILSFSIHQQTIALLEDLAESLRTFVPTESYRRAERALYEHGFVVLVGPPASGKSSIAANLCMVAMAQDPDARVLRVERAGQFKETWSPADEHTIYWVDDVFGETTLDADLVREWSPALEKVETARKRKARIIFCTRDYILASAERIMKRSKTAIINDARVRVDVTALSQNERDAIMYNHIKDGDIPQARKKSLKKHLADLARLPAFSPELARRLGSQRFTANLRHDWPSLRGFFERPVSHFADVIHGLSGAETAALTVCLMNDNKLPDPVADTPITRTVCTTYGVGLNEVAEALENLEGSLVKRVRQSSEQSWQLHHPSMVEALQEDLVQKSSKLKLYLEGAKLHAVLRDTTTDEPPADSRLVFLPVTMYPPLLARLRAESSSLEAVADYLANRSSDEFLEFVNRESPSLIDECLAIVPDPWSGGTTISLAVRLGGHGAPAMFDESRRAVVRDALFEALERNGWCGFLDNGEFTELMPDLVEELVRADEDAGFSSSDRLYEWLSEDLSSKDLLENAKEELEAHASRVVRYLRKQGGHDAGAWTVRASVEPHVDELEEALAKEKEAEEERADYMQDEWKERWYEEKYELERGRFSDVDE